MAKKIISIVDNLIFLLLQLADKISGISKILIPYMSHCLCAMIGKITEHKFLVLPIPIAVEGFVLDSFAALYRGFISGSAHAQGSSEMAERLCLNSSLQPLIKGRLVSK